jgi:hypothetical protein
VAAARVQEDREAATVAFSFKRRFVAPICFGLGREVPDGFLEPGQEKLEPKRQTIRSERADGRVAAEGDRLQLYYAQRTKHCLLVGVARCVEALPITIEAARDLVIFARPPRTRRFSTGEVLSVALDRFARGDGFADWADMRAFWREEHAGMCRFVGVITFWEPIA